MHLAHGGKATLHNMLQTSLQSQIATYPQCRHLANSTFIKLSLILAHWLHYVKKWRHPQNRKYITYCKVVKEEPSHGHGYHVQKIWGNLDLRFTRYARGQTDRQTVRQTDRNTLHRVGGEVNIYSACERCLTLVTMSGDDPFVNRTLITYTWPCCAAWCNGV